MRSAGKSGNWLLLVIMLIIALSAGGIIAELLRPFTWANFLTYTQSFGVGDTHPVTLNLSVLQLSFGIGVHINLLQELLILATLLIYRKMH